MKRNEKGERYCCDCKDYSDESYFYEVGSYCKMHTLDRCRESKQGSKYYSPRTKTCTECGFSCKKVDAKSFFPVNNRGNFRPYCYDVKCSKSFFLKMNTLKKKYKKQMDEAKIEYIRSLFDNWIKTGEFTR